MNAQYTVLVAYPTVLVIVAGFLGRLLSKWRYLLDGVTWLAIVALPFNALSYMAAGSVRASFRTEFRSMWDGRDPPGDSSADIVRWIDSHVPKGASIFGDLDFQLRRKVTARVSVDSDLLSLVPYAPATARPAVEEIKRDYGVDLVALAKGHGRIWDAISNDRWSMARDRVIADRSANYDFVVETATRPKSRFEPIYANPGYRVYEVGKTPSAAPKSE